VAISPRLCRGFAPVINVAIVLNLTPLSPVGAGGCRSGLFTFSKWGNIEVVEFDNLSLEINDLRQIGSWFGWKGRMARE
jgi:hypothetical protein